jgi:hypothetical protein
VRASTLEAKLVGVVGFVPLLLSELPGAMSRRCLALGGDLGEKP